MPLVTLTPQDRMVLTNALLVAAEQYRKDAKSCGNTAHADGLVHSRLVRQFQSQADEAVTLANRIDQANEVIIR